MQTRARNEISFNIDGGHMYEFDRTLYNWAVTYPAETGAAYRMQLRGALVFQVRQTCLKGLMRPTDCSADF